ncbi:MAG: glycosyltransferase [Methylobacter sp.]
MGSLEKIIDNFVEGWAWDSNHPDDVLAATLSIDGHFITNVRCGQFREDLEKAGIGKGNHGFRVPIPSKYLDDAAHTIDIRVGEQSLSNSPRKVFLAQEDPTALPAPASLKSHVEKDSPLGDLVAQAIAAEFDCKFYLARYPEIREVGIDPLEHYVNTGWREGRDPHPEFSTDYYLDNNPDIRDAGVNPFWHFIVAGRAEGRPGKAVEASEVIDEEVRKIVSKEFDRKFYIENNPDVADLVVDPIEHFLLQGWREGRDPNADFSVKYYLKVSPDIKAAGINPFWHYIIAGRAEGRPSKPPRSHEDTVREAIADAFDAAYYREQNPDILENALDPLTHFVTSGWREGRDPAPWFSVQYYLDTNPDIRDAGINPFWHYIIAGQYENRNPISFMGKKCRQEYKPFISVIVPNYNHAKFLPKRLDCILQQTYKNIELIVLDDKSMDNSVDVINDYVKHYGETVRPMLNTKNSGGVFNQWQKGIAAAKGELIWICESDDFCELNFLENVIQVFADESVMMAFGRIQFADRQGNLLEGLDGYRESAESGIWSRTEIRTASQWFNTAFGISNIIPNVGGCVFRNQPIAEDVWDEAKRYKILGDWFLYAVLCGGGRIAYVPDAVAYFRQHGRNTSVSSFRMKYYYTEHKRIIDYLRERWGTPDDIALKFFGKVYQQFKYVQARESLGDLLPIFDIEDTLKRSKTTTHILICSLGFYLGGGEIFPIYLANELVKRGYIISFLTLDAKSSELRIRHQLDPRIAVYEAHFVQEIGVDRFIRESGVDLIHSHVIGIEFFFFGKTRPHFNIPYIVSLHGSYEVTPMPDDILFRVLRHVSHWVYLTPKNLGHLKEVPIAKEKLTFIANGMPVDSREFSKSRKDLGIGENDLVFTLVSRAMKEKGWRPAVEAIQMAQTKTERKLFLLLCGSGPEADALKEEYADDPAIHILGFQDRIHGVYRISDCAILPTRFLGESFPLTLIQAMQVGTPVIATDVGEIKKMVVADGLESGLTIEWTEDDAAFVDNLMEAMLAMTNDEFRKKRATDAKKLGEQYSISSVADKYIDVYDKELEASRVK